MKITSCLCLVFALLCGSVSPQQMPEHLVQSSRLSFNALFFHTPTGASQNYGEEANYTWEDKVTDKKHPNTRYLISVWETNNKEDKEFTQRKQDSLIAVKLYDKQLTLKGKQTLPKEVPLTYYIFDTNQQEKLHFYICETDNKVYTMEVKTRPGKDFNYEVVMFMKGFNIALPAASQPIAINPEELSFTIDFPYTPQISKSEDTYLISLDAFCRSPQKEEEVTITFGDETEVVKTMVDKDSVSMYQATEIKYKEEIVDSLLDEDDLYLSFIHRLLELRSGRLIKQEPIKMGELEGRSVVMVDITDRICLYRLLRKQHTVYMLHTQLGYMVMPNCQQAIKFLDSFRIK